MSRFASDTDATRRPRSLTLHYLRPPAEGPCEVAVTIERAGRGLSTVSARLRQDGPDGLSSRPPTTTAGPDIPFRHRFEVRHAIGGSPFEVSGEAETGEVWSADGRLLAESRQLAVVLGPVPG